MHEFQPTHGHARADARACRRSITWLSSRACLKEVGCCRCTTSYSFCGAIVSCIGTTVPATTHVSRLRDHARSYQAQHITACDLNSHPRAHTHSRSLTVILSQTDRQAGRLATCAATAYTLQFPCPASNSIHRPQTRTQEHHPSRRTPACGHRSPCRPF